MLSQMLQQAFQIQGQLHFDTQNGVIFGVVLVLYFQMQLQFEVEFVFML